MRSLYQLLFAIVLIMSTSVSAFSSEQYEATSAELVIVNIADLHSAYDNYPYLLQGIQDLSARHGKDNLVTLINGDIFEYGNVVARHSSGEADWLFLQKLQEHSRVILNLGNHEFDFQSPTEFIERAEATGIHVIGNIGTTDDPYLAPPFIDVEVADTKVRIIGIATSTINTYPPEYRESLVIPNAAAWFSENFTELGGQAAHVIIASHAGIHDDRQILEQIKPDDDVLFMVGGHNHLVLRESVNGIDYHQNGLKGERLSIASLRWSNDAIEVDLRIIDVETLQGQDGSMAAEIRRLRQQYLGEQQLEVIGQVARNKSLPEAALWAVDALREKSNADLAVLNHTSFGSGLSAGELKRYRFDEFVRFDNEVMVAEIDGKTLESILAKANQHRYPSIENRSGDFLYANDIEIDPESTYQLATSAWIADSANQVRYLGVELPFEKLSDLTTKGLLIEALNR